MGQSNEKLIKKLSREFYRQLHTTYLEEEDLRQEAQIALLVANSIPNLIDPEEDVRDYLRLVIARSQLESSHDIKDARAIAKAKRRRLIIEALIDRCTRIQRMVLKLIYGLLDGKCRNYEEIAKIFHLSKDRIAEIEKEAIQSIQRMKGLHLLRSKFLR